METLIKNLFWRFRYYFVTAMFVLAVIIYAAWLQQQSQRALEAKKNLQEKQETHQREEYARLASIQEAERQKRAVEQRAAELKAFKNLYLNDQTTRHAVVVLVVNDTGQPNKILNSALLTLLKTNGHDATTLLLTPRFISDGLFTEVFTGSKAVLAKLDLKNLAGTLLLGRQTVDYSTNAALENLVTAHMKLELQTLPLTAGGQEQTQILESVGTELNRPTDARLQAEDRMVKQIQKQSEPLLGSIQSTANNK